MKLCQHCQCPKNGNPCDCDPMPSERTASGPSDATACSQCAEWRKLADDAINTLRITREKYGISDRHVMREKNRETEKLRVALKDATELLGEIMRDEVNHQDEAEKWLRAYGEICPANRPSGLGRLRAPRVRSQSTYHHHEPK